MTSSQLHPDYFYRTFSESRSTGGLVSGKGRDNRKLSPYELLYEFKNHKSGARKFNEAICHERLTALVSVTTSLVDALRRAFDKFYRGDKAEQIWIVFISVPHKDKVEYHHAKNLAQKIGQKEPNVFVNEYIFEWEVPEKYVVHKVSVHTLVSRGFNMERYCERDQNTRKLPPANLLKQLMAKWMLNPGYDIGMSLGSMARCFGARAPVQAIAHRILSECTRSCDIHYLAQSVRVSYWDDHGIILDFEHFYWIETGIEEALLDLWLHDIDFCLALKKHHQWVSRLEDEIKQDWEIFGEKVYYEELTDLELHYQTLEAREELIQAEIEMAAVRLGL